MPQIVSGVVRSAENVPRVELKIAGEMFVPAAGQAIVLLCVPLLPGRSGRPEGLLAHEFRRWQLQYVPGLVPAHTAALPARVLQDRTLRHRLIAA